MSFIKYNRCVNRKREVIHKIRTIEATGIEACIMKQVKYMCRHKMCNAGGSSADRDTIAEVSLDKNH